MKLKLSWILTLIMALMIQFSFAQGKTVTGTVTSQSDGLPLPGVSVLVKGTTNGTQTDFDGKYSLTVNTGETIVFSSLGYKTVEIVVGASNVIDVAFEDDVAALDEVVVTALGVKRQAKSLGYGVTTLKSNELNEVRKTDALEALKGRTSGAVVTSQGGNVGASQRILIRGVATLGGDQQPLFVIDGVPINNSQVATGSRITGGFDFGNRAQDINPDDIESISILKGASAAALYGSRAANGVVLINTKKAKEGSKLNVSVNSSLRFDDPLRLPDFQNEFAFGQQDANGVPTTDGTIGINQGNPGAAGWGERISDLQAAGRTFIDYDGQVRGFNAFEDNVRDFYETAVLNINNFAVSGATRDADYRFSVSYTDQQGLIPESRLNRTNISTNAGFQISPKLKARTSINYVRTNTRGTAAVGANDPNVLTNIVNGLPRVANIDLFRNFLDEAGNQINTVGLQQNNPFFVAIQNSPTVTVERFFGNTQLEFKPIEKLTLLGRAGYDTSSDTRLLVNRIGTLGNAQGSFTDVSLRQRELTLDFIAAYDDIQLAENLKLSARAGIQWNERETLLLQNTGQQLQVPNLFAPGNAAVNNPVTAFALRRLFGLFGDITLDYKGWAFLNATARNDWTSTLPLENNSFFYPSVSASLILSDALDIKSDFLSYLKLRGNWAEVGVDTNAFLTNFTFNPDIGFFGQFGTGGNFPTVTFNSDGQLPDPNLVAETQSTFEVGFEVGFWNNRVTLDATYYNSTTRDLIQSVVTPDTSGFGNFFTNIGELSNRGVEIELGATIIQTKDFTWDLDVNFTSNDFEVNDLGVPDVLLASEFSSLQVRAIDGGEIELTGDGFARATDANGNDIDDQILVNAQGLRFAGNQRNFGSIFPDFNAGLTTGFSYKGFRLSTTFDWREGGVFFSNTVGQLRRAGLAEETAVNDRAQIVDDAFILDGGGNAVANTVAVSPQAFWQAFANASIPEGNIFDATFIKWREISLTYSFPSKLLENTFIKGLSISVQGRNLAIFNTDVPHVDPETSIGGAASNLQGIERGGVPNTRSIGFSASINF